MTVDLGGFLLPRLHYVALRLITPMSYVVMLVVYLVMRCSQL